MTRITPRAGGGKPAPTQLPAAVSTAILQTTINNASDGQTIVVAPGTLSGAMLSIPRGLTGISLIAQVPGTVTLAGNPALSTYPALYIEGNNHLVAGFVFTNPTGDGLKARYFNKLTIRNNTFTSNGRHGILLGSEADGNCFDYLIEGNTLTGNGADISLDTHGDGSGTHAIYAGGGVGVTYGGVVRFNTIRNHNNGQAIQIGGSQWGGTVCDNFIDTITVPAAVTADQVAGVGLFNTDGTLVTKNIEVLRNTVRNNKGYAVKSAWSATGFAQGNRWTNCGLGGIGQVASGVMTDGGGNSAE